MTFSLGRACWLTASLGACCWWCAAAEELEVRLNSDRLKVAAPSLDFLSGKPLERLKNGASVLFHFQLSLLSENKLVMLERAAERFVVSYDLWEETFSVARSGTARPVVSHLQPQAARAWCLDNLSAPTARLARDARFWVRLEVRVGGAPDTPPVMSEPGLSLTGLVEVFSRKARAQMPAWSLERGPLSISQLAQ